MGVSFYRVHPYFIRDYAKKNNVDFRNCPLLVRPVRLVAICFRLSGIIGLWQGIYLGQAADVAARYRFHSHRQKKAKTHYQLDLI